MKHRKLQPVRTESGICIAVFPRWLRSANSNNNNNAFNVNGNNGNMNNNNYNNTNEVRPDFRVSIYDADNYVGQETVFIGVSGES